MLLVSCHIFVNSEILYRNISLTIPSPHSFRPVCFKVSLPDCRLALEVASGYACTLCSSVCRLSATWNISSLIYGYKIPFSCSIFSRSKHQYFFSDYPDDIPLDYLDDISLDYPDDISLDSPGDIFLIILMTSL